MSVFLCHENNIHSLGMKHYLVLFSMDVWQHSWTPKSVYKYCEHDNNTNVLNC